MERDHARVLVRLGGQRQHDAALWQFPCSLLTLFDAEHGLGGISGYDVAETTDENPARVSVVQRLTSAYLRTQLNPGDPAWQSACDELAAGPDPLGRVESKEE